MNHQIYRNDGSAYAEVFQKIIGRTPGGAVISLSELPTGTLEIRQGTGISVASSGIVYVNKTATLYANAAIDAVVYQVEKGHLFKVGDFLTTADVDDVKAYAITAIDTTTNTTHDVLTVGTTLGVALTAGVIMIQAVAEDSTGGAFTQKYPINAFVGEYHSFLTEEISTANISVSEVIRADLYEARLPHPISTTQKALLAGRLYFL